MSRERVGAVNAVRKSDFCSVCMAGIQTSSHVGPSKEAARLT
jgi:hypothetical protein